MRAAFLMAIHKKHSEGGRLEPEFNGWLGFKKRSCV